MNNNHNKEQTIDVLDMFKRLLKKWKLILLVGIVCAAAGMLYAYKTYSNRENLVRLAGMASQYSSTNTEITDSIPRDKRNTVESALIQYSSYSDEIRLIREHLKNSVYLNLGYETIPTITLSYLIDTADGEAAVNDIRSTYISNLKSDDVVRGIISGCGLDIEPIFFGELVSFDYDSNEDFSIKDSKYSDINIKIPKNSMSNLLNISICGQSREACELAAAQYKTAISMLTPQIKNELDSLNFELQTVGEIFSENDGKQIAELRSAQSSRILELSNLILEVESTLDVEDRALYKQLKSAQSLIGSGDEEQPSEVNEPTAGFVNKKALAIGFIAGVFVMCAYLCLRYIMSSCIRVKTDISEMYGLTDCIDEDNIRSIINRKGYKKVAVLGAAKDRIGIESTDISEADAAILVEIIDISKADDIRHEIDICNQHDVTIIGYIVFE